MWKFLLGWFIAGCLHQELTKRGAEAEALKLRDELDKPIINIGAKCNPFGDIRCDIDPKCEGVVYCDAENMEGYYDKQFSVALLSHVLEHLNDPNKAIAEAERIADNVIIVTPSPIFPQTWLHPDHKWVFHNGQKIRIRGK